MRPPLAMEWISVSSRSRIKVLRFERSVSGSARVYDGCRRGIRGLGGAGARGYFVIAEGDVGDLAAAARASTEGGLTPPEPSDCVAGDEASVDLRPALCLRMLSSLCSLIRIDRRAGVISSVVFDLEDLRPLVEWRLELSLWRSDSDSEDTPDDEDVACGVGLLSLDRHPEGVFSSDMGTDSRFRASSVKGSMPLLPFHAHFPRRLIW